jgi:thiamine-monophosphate kinase
MIDVSDGLAADLGHLLDASGVGCALDDVPVAPGATLADALGGGEDYELVFTVPDGTAIDWAIPIGVCTDDPSERTLGGEPLPAVGWQHYWD